MPKIRLVPIENEVKLTLIEPPPKKIDEEVSEFESVIAGAPSAAPIPAPSGERGEIGKALLRGVPGAVAGLGKGLTFLGEELHPSETPATEKAIGIGKLIPEKGKVRKFGEKVAKEFGDIVADPELAPSKEFLSQPWYYPKRLAATTVEAAPLTVAAVGTGILATVATKNPLVGTIVASSIFGATSAGEILEEGEKAGISRKDAMTAARLAGAGESALEFIPGMMFMKMLGGKQLKKEVLKEGFKELRRASRVARSAGKITLAESLEEGAQTAKDNLIARGFYDSERAIFEGVPESMTVGGIMGLGLGGAGGTIKAAKQADILRQIENEINKLPESELSKDLKTQLLVDLRGQVANAPTVDDKVNLIPVQTPEVIAKDLDITYNGIQEGVEDIPDTHLFTDKVTGTTFGVETLGEVEQRLKEKRKEFGLVEVGEEELSFERFDESTPYAYTSFKDAKEDSTKLDTPTKVVKVENIWQIELKSDQEKYLTQEGKTKLDNKEVKKEDKVVTVDMHAGIPINKIVPKKWAPAWSEFWIPFSTVPNSSALLTKRYEQLGAVDKATRTMDMVHDRINKFDMDIRVDIFKYLDGQLSLLDLPIEARITASRVRDLQMAIGKKLVSRGILAEETFEKHKGNYVHYMFARHILGDEGPIGIGSTGKLNLSYTISRNENMTAEQRKELGLVEDAAIAVPAGMGKALMDIAKIDYLSNIAENPDWTWQPSLIKVDGQKMGIGKLVREVEALDRTLSHVESPEIRERYDRLKGALDEAIEETKNIPKEFKQLPSDSHYGPIAGGICS